MDDENTEVRIEVSEVLGYAADGNCLTSNPCSLQEEVCDTTVRDTDLLDAVLSENDCSAPEQDDSAGEEFQLPEERSAPHSPSAVFRRTRRRKLEASLVFKVERTEPVDEDERKDRSDIDREAEATDRVCENHVVDDGEDLCDFCGVDAASELCRGEECKQILGTNFPLYCRSCSQTLHKRYPQHRRFLDTARARGSVETVCRRSIARSSDQPVRPRDTRASTARYHHPYVTPSDDAQSTPREKYDNRTVKYKTSAKFSAGAHQNVAIRNRSRTTLSHAERMVADFDRNKANGPDRRQSRMNDTDLQPSMSMKMYEEAEEGSEDYPAPGSNMGPLSSAGQSGSFVSDGGKASSAARANQLQPIHERYQILLQFMQANLGLTLQEAYKVTGLARSTITGTRCVAELKRVNSKLYEEIVQKAGPKAKVAVLNRMCQDALSQPELEPVMARMRLRTELLPFSSQMNLPSQLSRQLQVCLSKHSASRSSAH